MHLVSYIDTQIARVTPLSVARIFGGLLPRLCSFMLIHVQSRAYYLYAQRVAWREHAHHMANRNDRWSPITATGRVESHAFQPQLSSPPRTTTHTTFVATAPSPPPTSLVYTRPAPGFEPWGMLNVTTAPSALTRKGAGGGGQSCVQGVVGVWRRRWLPDEAISTTCFTR